MAKVDVKKRREKFWKSSYGKRLRRLFVVATVIMCISFIGFVFLDINDGLNIIKIERELYHEIVLVDLCILCMSLSFVMFICGAFSFFNYIENKK